MVLVMAALERPRLRTGPALEWVGGLCLSPKDAAQAASDVVIRPCSGWKRR